jgi:hypothetical protein
MDLNIGGVDYGYELDLLSIYLKEKICSYGSYGQVSIIDVGFAGLGKLNVEQFMLMYRKVGVVLVDPINDAGPEMEELTFEKWKVYYNLQKEKENE